MQVDTSGDRRYLYLLPIVLLIGLVLRTWNVQWDHGLNTHPDERFTTCWVAPTIEWPENWDQFVDSRQSPLNPLWNRTEQRPWSYTYGHFPLYLGILIGEVLHRAAPIANALPVSDHIVELMGAANTACGGVAVAGRLLIALLDTLTILLLFRLGRRVYGPWAGLLAATFYAFTAQAIQLSHFFSMDPASTTFVVLAVLGGVQMMQERSWRGVVFSGVGSGLAIASKFSALPILAVPVMVAGIVLVQERKNNNGRTALRMLLGALLALLLAFAIFFITSPYAVLDWQNFVQATLVEQGAMVRGIADLPFTRQYRNTTPYLYFIEQQIAWGLWWPLGLLALAGTFWAAGKVLVLRARPGELIAWAWVVPYFSLTGAFLAKFNRYMSPVLPFALLFAAGMIWTLWQFSTQKRRDAEKINSDCDWRSDIDVRQAPQTKPNFMRFRVYTLQFLSVLLTVAGVAGGLFWSLAYVNGVYNTEHTWVTAGRWLFENAPTGSMILAEQWDDEPIYTVPDEPGMDRNSRGHIVIKWGPYEEDTAEKYAHLKEVLRQVDYVYYSSKRIYDSLDELPERYPMTIRYYALMFAEALGFEKAADFTTPPQLLGIEFPDQRADESWSLYDHPRVTIFKKKQDLSDAEFDELLGGTWEGAIPWYQGEASRIDPLLELLGLGSSPESQNRGLINAFIALLKGEEQMAALSPPPEERVDLLLDRPLQELPVVDNYRWNISASENPWLAVGWWWLVTTLLGWLAWPIAFTIFRPLRDRGYLFSRSLGWLLAGWLLWICASVGLAYNTVVNVWLSLAVVGVLGAMVWVWHWREINGFMCRKAPLLLMGEGLFAVAYLLFVVIRMHNPDLWQPWRGGEKFMEFAFLNGILRSPTFPPVDPHFAGGYINYYYFGLYLVAYLIKLTGIYAEVAFNLAIPTLFALTVVNAFGVAYSAVAPARRKGSMRARTEPVGAEYSRPPLEPRIEPQQTFSSVAPIRAQANADVLGIDLAPERTEVAAERTPMRSSGVAVVLWPPAVAKSGKVASLPWQHGVGWALLAPLFVAVIGNLDGFAQIVRRLVELSPSNFQSAIPGVATTVYAFSGFWRVLTTDVQLPSYDFWGPSRVIGAEIQATINEFPYWSFTFADLHPHLIGLPFTVFFLGLVLTVLLRHGTGWRRQWRYSLLLLTGFAFLLGALASINLWELPTYYGLGVLALAVSFFWLQGSIGWPLLVAFAVVYLAGAYVLFWPFFDRYETVGASGIGLVRAPDDLGEWLRIWGFFLFVLVSWLLYMVVQPARLGIVRTHGLERWLSLAWRNGERLPRLLHLHGLLVQRPTVWYLLGQWLVPLLVAVAVVLAWLDWTILALCLPCLGLAFLLLWRRGRAADPGDLFATLLTTTGFALLAGTQVFYLKDFLQGGDHYRMNTIFKFFMQIWVLWGVAAAIAVARIFDRVRHGGKVKSIHQVLDGHDSLHPTRPMFRSIGRNAWVVGFGLLLAASFAYPLWGTPARLEWRFPNWQPPLGTLNGMDFMQQGVYTLPDSNNLIELHYDWKAIQWLLAYVRGNMVVAESAEVGYYLAGGTRVASLTGLSGLNGMHEGEQRYGDAVGQRHALHREFWETLSIERTQELIEQLAIDLVYVSQLERLLHPQGAAKLAEMAGRGLLLPVYTNEEVVIYAVPRQMLQAVDGRYYSVAGAGER